MTKPLVCFLSYNRAGASAQNLKALLATKDDFDLCILDNGSSDGIWEYIQTLDDPRIIFRHHFTKNCGVVYAINYALSKRKKDQPFIHVENDVWIEDPHWIQKFESTRKAFPDLGLIGAASKGHFQSSLSHLTPTFNGAESCFYSNVIIGCCHYLTPEVIELIGYWNEESCGADKEIGPRINLCTPYKTAYTGNFNVSFRTQIPCNTCPMIDLCAFKREVPCECCRVYYPTLYTHKSFSTIVQPKTAHYLHALQAGECSCYSASIHDPLSRETHPYDMALAQENFEFFSNYKDSHK
ncbi:MAG: glycosyltransferase family 2 protein [Cellulosilyticaceae bacterium]